MAWFRTIFNKDPELKQFKNNNTQMPKNIYDGKTYSEHAKQFHWVHYVFKYKILMPGIWLFRKLFGKYIIKTVDDQSHNRNIKIWDNAFEDAIKKWDLYYRRNSGDPSQRKTKEQVLDEYEKTKGNNGPGSAETLRLMKELVMTMVLQDTAYREFLNIWMHEIATQMVKEYANKKKYPKKATGHLFFTTDIYDVHYYVLEKAIRYNVEIGVSDCQKIIGEYYAEENAKQNQ